MIAIDFQRHQSFLNAIANAVFQRGFADEIGFIHFDKSIQPRFEGIKFRDQIRFPVQEPFFHPHGFHGTRAKQSQFMFNTCIR